MPAPPQTIRQPQYHQPIANKQTGQADHAWYRWWNQINTFLGGASGPSVPTISDIGAWSMSKH